MRIRIPNTGKKKSSCYLGEGGDDVDEVQILPDCASRPTTVQPSPDSAVVGIAEKSSIIIGKSQQDERFGTKGPAWTKFFRRGEAGGARTSNDNTYRRDAKIDIEWPFDDEHEESSCNEKADVFLSAPSHGEEGSQAVLWIRDIYVRIRIRGSVPQTYGYGSSFFCQWLADKMPRKNKFCFLNVHLHQTSKIKSQKEVTKYKWILRLFLLFLLVDGRIRIREAQKHPQHCSQVAETSLPDEKCSGRKLPKWVTFLGRMNHRGERRSSRDVSSQEELRDGRSHGESMMMDAEVESLDNALKGWMMEEGMKESYEAHDYIMEMRMMSR
jgi:hypothetical protein